MLTISTASGADAEAILVLQKLAYQSEAELYGDWSIPPLTQELSSLRGEFVTSLVLKATMDGRLVGSVRARASGGRCAIGRLIVHPDLQGQGIGSALLRAIEGCFPRAAQYELFTGSRSEANIRLYRRHGYEITRTGRSSEAVTLVFMEKPGRPSALLPGSGGSAMFAPCIGDCGKCAATSGTTKACSDRQGGGEGPAAFCRHCVSRVCGVLRTGTAREDEKDIWRCLFCGWWVCLQQEICIFCGRARAQLAE